MRNLLVALALLGSALILHVTPAEGGNWPESCGKNKTHNFTFGRAAPYDRLLYVSHPARGSSLLRKQSFDVEIPPRGTYPRGIISYVQVVDQYRDGNGGCAYLKSGGPGYVNVTLHVKSQRGKGINFVVNVFGH